MTKIKMTRYLLILLVVGLLAVPVGCARNETPSNNSEPTSKVSESSTQNLVDLNSAPNSSATESTETANDNVILYVYSNEGGKERGFILSGEEVQFVTDLFYSHEKEVHSTPCDCLYSFGFQIGTDHLGTTESLGTLDGMVGGEFVSIRLSEAENEALYQLITQYAQIAS